MSGGFCIFSPHLFFLPPSINDTKMISPKTVSLVRVRGSGRCKHRTQLAPSPNSDASHVLTSLGRHVACRVLGACLARAAGGPPERSRSRGAVARCAGSRGDVRAVTARGPSPRPSVAGMVRAWPLLHWSTPRHLLGGGSSGVYEALRAVAEQCPPTTQLRSALLEAALPIDLGLGRMDANCPDQDAH